MCVLTLLRVPGRWHRQDDCLWVTTGDSEVAFVCLTHCHLFPKLRLCAVVFLPIWFILTHGSTFLSPRGGEHCRVLTCLFCTIKLLLVSSHQKWFWWITAQKRKEGSMTVGEMVLIKKDFHLSQTNKSISMLDEQLNLSVVIQSARSHCTVYPFLMSMPGF